MYYRHRQRRNREVNERRNELLHSEFQPDPFVTPPPAQGTFQTYHTGDSSFMTEHQAFISPVATSTTPSQTYSRPAMSEVDSRPSVSTRPQNQTQPSEKQRFLVLHHDEDASTAAATEPTAYPASTVASDDAEANPHHDFPPPDYGQVFPPSSSSS